MSAYSLTLPAIWLVVSGMLGAVLCLAALSKKGADFPRKFALAMASVVIYSLGYALELGAADLDALRLALRIEYLGVPFISSFWVIAAFSYAQKPLTARQMFLLLLLPGMTFLLAQSNDLHHLFYAKLGYSRLDGMAIAVIEGGPWYYVHNAYTQVCFVLYNAVLLRSYLHSQPLFRTQALLLLLASFVPWVCLVFYLFGFSPAGLDLNPFGLMVTGVVSSLAVWRYEFLTLVPIARDVVFNSIEEAVLVINEDQCLIDFNHAASRIFPELSSSWIGRPLSRLMGASVIEKALPADGGPGRLQMTQAGVLREYELRRYALRGSKSELRGRAILLQDITVRLALERQLIDLATHDELTGLHNRHYLMEHAGNAVQCARRYGRTLSVLIGDMDGFKQVNDQQGHLAGDRLLQQVADCLQRRLRQTDIIGRYGGDEFVIVLPETGGDEARRIARELCEFIVRESGSRMSIGVASLQPEHADFLAVLHDADTDLYQAKSSRSQTGIFVQEPLGEA